MQEHAPLIAFATASGAFIYIGDLSQQYGVALAGCTVSVPLFASCIVIVGEACLHACMGFGAHPSAACAWSKRSELSSLAAGTLCNYFLDHGLNRSTLLFPGVACFACAVVAGSLSHVLHETHLLKGLKGISSPVLDHERGGATATVHCSGYSKDFGEGSASDLLPFSALEPVLCDQGTDCYPVHCCAEGKAGAFPASLSKATTADELSMVIKLPEECAAAGQQTCTGAHSSFWHACAAYRRPGTVWQGGNGMSQA